MPVTAIAFFLLAAVLSPQPAHDFWTTGARMSAPGTGQMEVRLHDGRFLVLGGEDVTDGFPVATAQIYDPLSNTWAYAPNMKTGRIGGTATTLADGDVLVVGGLGPRLGPLRACEVFDPLTSTWSTTTSLPETRFAHSASLLPNGRVLIAGGIVGSEISSSALLFDPATHQWLPTLPATFAHAQQTAIDLEGGHILLTGGYGAPETYDTGSSQWSATAGTVHRSHPVVMELRDGSVLMAGGVSTGERDLRSASVYHPTTGRWTGTGSLHTARNQAAAALLPNGGVLVAGGEQVTVHVLRSAEIFDPVTNTWNRAAPMRTARDAAVTLPLQDGTSMICGGMNLTGVLSSCETYHP